MSPNELRTAQTRFDRRIERELQATSLPVFYCAGCFTCCDMAIDVTWHEALHAAAQATPEQLAAHRGRAERVVALAHRCQGERQFVVAYRQEAGMCPFLQPGGLCGVYAARPGACRNTYSSRESRYCASDMEVNLTPDERAEYLQTNQASAELRGFSHYLGVFDRANDQYHQDLARLGERDHRGLISGDWSVLLTLVGDPALRGELAVTRQPERVARLLEDHRLFHPHVLRYRPLKKSGNRFHAAP